MAVYTEVSDDDLAAFVASYGLGALLSYKGIAEGVENTNYLVHTDKGPFFLTLYEKRVAPRRPAVLPGPDGAPGQGRHQLPDARPRRARPHAAHAGGPARGAGDVPGRRLDQAPAARHCLAVGEALARLHRGGRGFDLDPRQRARACRLASALRALPIARRRDRAGPRRHHRAGARGPGSTLAGRPAAGHHPRRSVSRQRLLPGRQALRRSSTSTSPATTRSPTTSPSRSTPGASRATIPSTSPRARRCSKGYQSVRALTPAEAEALPLLARGAALRFLLTRAHDWLHTSSNALVQPQGPHRIPAPAQIPSHRSRGARVRPGGSQTE